MGEAGANMARWTGLYGGGAAEGTVVTPGVGRSAPGGRVGKPARRRSRASRRAPVTLLNTDTSNFRAMVQQFTGAPSAPYGPVTTFGAVEFGGATPLRPSPMSAVTSFGHLAQHRRPAATSSSLQSQIFQPQHQLQQQYGGGDIFLHHHGFESSSAAAVEEEDRLLLLQSMQAAAQMMPRPASMH